MKNKILSLLLIFVLAFSIGCSAFEFEVFDMEDIIESSSEWAKPEVDKAKELALIPESFGLFYTKDITRSQFAELVVTMVEKVLDKPLPAADESTFADSDELFVLKAYKSGIVNGMSESTFEGEILITREQIAAMLHRAILFLEKETNKAYIDKNEVLDNFDDSAEVSTWAAASVAVLANSGIMNGTSATTLSPKINASIEQCILLTLRLYEKIK